VESNQVVRDGETVSSLIDELLVKYPICGIGPLAWLEAADAVAVVAGKTMLEVLSRWVYLSGFNGISVALSNDELSVSELIK